MTIIQQACRDVPAFEPFYQKFLRIMTINDRALSTQVNYSRSLANLAIHFKQLPTALSLDQVQDYLYYLKQNRPSLSDNCFKFAVASLRFVFKMEGMQALSLRMPSIRKNKKLPVVLSKSEITAMMNAPHLLRHRVLIALLYGCGLRCNEARNVKVNDIDFERSLLHVRQGKGRKDRYLPLGSMLSDLLRTYLQLQKPGCWLFPGRFSDSSKSKFCAVFDPQFGKRSIQWAIKRAASLAGITKNVSVHSLRHTYATHLLEEGVNILTIKELMGHAYVDTTMIYLQVAQVSNHCKRSPLDSLSGLKLLNGLQIRLF